MVLLPGSNYYNSQSGSYLENDNTEKYIKIHTKSSNVLADLTMFCSFRLPVSSKNLDIFNPLTAQRVPTLKENNSRTEPN